MALWITAMQDGLEHSFGLYKLVWIVGFSEHAIVYMFTLSEMANWLSPESQSQESLPTSHYTEMSDECEWDFPISLGHLLAIWLWCLPMQVTVHVSFFHLVLQLIYPSPSCLLLPHPVDWIQSMCTNQSQYCREGDSVTGAKMHIYAIYSSPVLYSVHWKDMHTYSGNGFHNSGNQGC